MAATALEADIRARIASQGPIPVADYMALCLADPRHGYYVTRDPFGARGDFVTAPEVSQMFGELIGIWIAMVWQQMGSPARVRIVELGPGRGTLMSDALRALTVVPALLEAARVHLVEISPVLKAKQQETLRGVAPPVSWHASLEPVPEGPAIVIANEFFDALPVHQAVRTAHGWHERCVGTDGGKLIFTSGKPVAKPLPSSTRDAPEGAIFEWRDDGAAIATGAGRRAQARQVVRGHDDHLGAAACAGPRHPAARRHRCAAAGIGARSLRRRDLRMARR